MDDYQQFLASKHVYAHASGFKAGCLPGALFHFQADSVNWACQQGRAGIWAAVGLGKTAMQLAWAEQVCRHTNGKAFILCPLAVARQTAREAIKFQIDVPVTVVRGQQEVKPGAGISVTNYQMLRHFDSSAFTAVVVDESDILADFGGSTRKKITQAFRDTPYKLDCSATPAPNDHMEIGQHADFLDVMEGTEMLSRWFINDAGKAGNYRLKEHGQEDFWRWVASWACAIRLPSDLGYENDGYILPPLNIVEHLVPVEITDGRKDGYLFRLPSMSATTMHQEMRRTSSDRAGEAMRIVESIPRDEAILIWCHTDYEADELGKQIKDAVEIRGSHTIERKEQALDGFIDGSVRILIGKPSMFGHGLNLQHCHNMIFVGLDYSFKGFHQAIGRCYRFGQKHRVNVHVILAETEGRLLETIERKQADFEAMQVRMIAAITRHGLGAKRQNVLAEYNPAVEMRLPRWLNALA